MEYGDTTKIDTVYTLLQDHLSGTNTIFDGQGASSVRYDVWGEARDDVSDAPTSRLYTGQEKAAGLGLYYYNARWYDSQLGRFIQPDTIVPNPYNPIDLDRYAYVRNNPINMNDPTGHDVGCPASNPACSGISGYADSQRYLDYLAKVKSDKSALHAYLKTSSPILSSFSPVVDSRQLPGLPPRPYVAPEMCYFSDSIPHIQAYNGSQPSSPNGVSIPINADHAADGLDAISAGADVVDLLNGGDAFAWPSAEGMFVAAYAQDLRDQDLGLTENQRASRIALAVAEDVFISTLSAGVGGIFGYAMVPINPVLVPYVAVGGYVTANTALSQTMERDIRPFIYYWLDLEPR